MLIDFAIYAVLGAVVVGAVLFIARGGRRPFRAGLDRLVAQHGWVLDEEDGHSTGRIALRLTPGDGAGWSVTLRESTRRSPGRSDVRRTLAARFHSPTPHWPDGWLAIVPRASDRITAGATSLAAFVGAPLDMEDIRSMRLGSVLPEAALETPARPVTLTGLPEGYEALLAGPATAPPPELDVSALAAVLQSWHGSSRRGHARLELALGPDGLRVASALPVHPLTPAAPVLERLIARSLDLRAAMLKAQGSGEG